MVVLQGRLDRAAVWSVANPASLNRHGRRGRWLNLDVRVRVAPMTAGREVPVSHQLMALGAFLRTHSARLRIQRLYLRRAWMQAWRIAHSERHQLHNWRRPQGVVMG